MSSGSELDALDARAEEVDFDSESSFKVSSSDSEAFSSEGDADLAQYANVSKRVEPESEVVRSSGLGLTRPIEGNTSSKRRSSLLSGPDPAEVKRSRKAGLQQRNEYSPGPLRASTPDNSGSANRDGDPHAEDEEEPVDKTATWRDMEDARRFLTEDHLERLDGLISKWENVEEGDDVDLNTGMVVNDRGHLNALNLQKQNDMLWFLSEEGSDDDDEEDEEEISDDPILRVCQKPPVLLDSIVETVRGRWML